MFIQDNVIQHISILKKTAIAAFESAYTSSYIKFAERWVTGSLNLLRSFGDEFQCDIDIAVEEIYNLSGDYIRRLNEKAELFNESGDISADPLASAPDTSAEVQKITHEGDTSPVIENQAGQGVNFDKYREIARQFLIGRMDLQGGYVFIHDFKVSGWCPEIYPENWKPGVIAVSNTGALYIMRGGNDQDGAEIAQFLDGVWISDTHLTVFATKLLERYSIFTTWALLRFFHNETVWGLFVQEHSKKNKRAFNEINEFIVGLMQS